MTHVIAVGTEFVEVIHTGSVGYEDRIAALEALGKCLSVHGGNALPVLIDLSAAQITPPLAESKYERADYIAQATLHWVFNGRRVAMVGMPRAAVQSVLAVAAMRQVQFAVFDDREQAIAWLLQR